MLGVPGSTLLLAGNSRLRLTSCSWQSGYKLHTPTERQPPSWPTEFVSRRVWFLPLERLTTVATADREAMVSAGQAALAEELNRDVFIERFANLMGVRHGLLDRHDRALTQP